jgi:cytochrome c nitrite reductase small subunit
VKLPAGASLAALVLCLLAGSLAGAGGYTVYTSGATAYLSDDPRACVNCHVMREHYDGWQKASHHALATCNDCHTPHALVPKYLTKAENGYWHSKGFTFQDFPEPIRIRPSNARVLNENCVTCHRGLVSEVIAHAGDRADLFNCVRCHAQVGHGPVR